MNHWREVRSKIGNKLLFRFCAERDEIEIKTPTGNIEVIALGELRPVRFMQAVDELKHLCYSSSSGVEQR